MEKDIRIAMIGAGGIAKHRHLPNLKKIEGVELVAVSNRRRQTAEQAAAEYGFQKVYDHWQDAMDDTAVNVVFICTPPYMHNEMTQYALDKGKHVFCQARMAMDLEEALLMKKADDQTQLTTMLCPPPHYLAVEQTVRDIMKSGKLGEIRHVALQHPGSMFLDPQQPLHWRQRADLQGINLLDVGIMGEVLQRWFGPIVQLSANGGIWIDERPADADGKTKVDLPDSTSIIARFQSRASLTALFSGIVAGGEPHMKIYGSKATLTCYANKDSIVIDTPEGSETKRPLPEQKGEWTVEEDFIQSVRKGHKGYPSFDEGISYMRFTQAIIDSMASGGNSVVIKNT